MPVHLKAEGRREKVEVWSARCARQVRGLHSAFFLLPFPFNATRNPGAGEGFTDFAAAVQLRLRVEIGLQTLTVKSRLLTGENSVRIRGDPPISTLP